MSYSNTPTPPTTATLVLGVLILVAQLLTIGILATRKIPEPTHKTYTATGYYSNETVVTEDGNMWVFIPDDPERFEGKSVEVTFDNNGTPDYIYDDEIVEIKEVKI